MAILTFPRARTVAFSGTTPAQNSTTAVVVPLPQPHPAAPDHSPHHVMARPDSCPYTTTAPPGVNVNRLRMARQWSIYALADACRPPLSASAISRIERNEGYTSDSLHRVASALNVPVEALFYPPEIAAYSRLPPDLRQRLADTIQDTAAAYDTRRRLPPKP